MKNSQIPDTLPSPEITHPSTTSADPYQTPENKTLAKLQDSTDGVSRNAQEINPSQQTPPRGHPCTTQEISRNYNLPSGRKKKEKLKLTLETTTSHREERKMKN